MNAKTEIDAEEWIGYARLFSVKDLRRLCEHARYVIDPEGLAGGAGGGAGGVHPARHTGGDATAVGGIQPAAGGLAL